MGFHQGGDCAFGSGTDTDVFKQLEETKEQPEGRGPGVEDLLSAGRQTLLRSRRASGWLQ